MNLCCVELNKIKYLSIRTNTPTLRFKPPLKHYAAGGSCKYWSSGSHISMNMTVNNPRETQKVTSECKECCLQIFSPGVHPKFWLEFPTFWIWELKIWHFSGKKRLLSKTFWCSICKDEELVGRNLPGDHFSFAATKTSHLQIKIQHTNTLLPLKESPQYFSVSFQRKQVHDLASKTY